jgi:voltage-gated potassium channel Kch
MSALSKLFAADTRNDWEGSETQYKSVGENIPNPEKLNSNNSNTDQSFAPFTPVNDKHHSKKLVEEKDEFSRIPSNTGVETFEIGRNSLTDGDKPATTTRNRSESGRALMKKGLVSINDLNDKFLSSNFYYVIIAIIIYVGVGVAAYRSMMDWSRFNCLYFIIITTTTVGYGDFVPDTEGKRVFTAFYIIVGVGIFGSLFGTITTFVSDHQERMAKLRSMRAMIRMKEELEKQQAAGTSASSHHKKALQEAMNPLQLQQQQQEQQPTDRSSSSGEESRSNSASVSGISRRLSFLSSPFSSEKRKEKSLEELRNASITAYEEDWNQLQRSAIIDFFVIFLLLIFGMIVMGAIEDWATGDAFYWATETIFTVGYGDLVPTTTEGKIFTIFYVVFGCAYMAKSLTDFVKFPLLARILHNEIKVVNQFSGDLSPDMLDTLFNNDLYQLVPDLKRTEDEMSKCEFVLLMLQVMGKVEEKDIFLAARLFDNFDKLKKGE